MANKTNFYYLYEGYVLRKRTGKSSQRLKLSYVSDVPTEVHRTPIKFENTPLRMYRADNGRGVSTHYL